MASRTFHPMQALNREVKIIAGSFAPAGTGAPTDVKGRGFSVARTSAGVFTITLEDKYIELLDAQATLQLASAADQFLQFGAIDVVSAKTIVINVWDASDGAVADISANANNRINFCLKLRNSSVA